jgi:hypothetical protein
MVELLLNQPVGKTFGLHSAHAGELWSGRLVYNRAARLCMPHKYNRKWLFIVFQRGCVVYFPGHFAFTFLLNGYNKIAMENQQE